MAKYLHIFHKQIHEHELCGCPLHAHLAPACSKSSLKLSPSMRNARNSQRQLAFNIICLHFDSPKVTRPRCKILTLRGPMEDRLHAFVDFKFLSKRRFCF
jgi:hypothetical protein